MQRLSRSVGEWLRIRGERTKPLTRRVPQGAMQLEALEDRTTPAFAGLPHPISVTPAGSSTGNSTSNLELRSLSADGRLEVFSSIASDLSPIDSNVSSDVFVRNLTTGVTTLVSVNSTGSASANGYSYGGVISADGRYVAFVSAASDLTAQVAVGYQIFRRDLLTNTTALVSLNSAGTASANDWSEQPSISSDGRLVAFRSYGSNVAPGVSDINFATDIFVRDMVAGTNRCISVTPAGSGVANYASTDATISTDGTRVVFSSQATNLVTGVLDNNQAPDLFVRNLISNVTTLVSQASNAVGTGDAGASLTLQSLSADGRYQVFSSSSSTYDHVRSDLNQSSDVFVRDMVLGTTTLVSVNSTGAVASNSLSDQAVISGNGRYVAFRSAATDITAGVTGGYHVYRRDLLTSTTVLVDFNSAGTIASNNWSEEPSISNDGRYIAFESYSTDLVAGVTDGNFDTDIFVRDLNLGTTKIASVNPGGTQAGNSSSSTPRLSGDGSTVVFSSYATNLAAAVLDNNSQADLFVRNLVTNTTALVSRTLSAAGTGEVGVLRQGNSLSADGRYEVFSSYSNTYDHTLPDTNNTFDIFVRDIVLGTTKLISVNSAGTSSANGSSDLASISADGNFVVYRSTATDLTPTPVSGYHFYRRDLMTNTTALVDFDSTNTAGGNNWAQNAAVSANGRFVAFSSYADNLVAGVTDANGDRDVFVRDMLLGTTKFVSVNPAGTTAGNSWSDYPNISADGSMATFLSNAYNLVAGANDNNNNSDLLARNLITNTTLLVSRTTAQAGTGELASQRTMQSISDDGRYMVFATDSSSMQTAVPDRNNLRDIYLRDRLTGATTLVTVNSGGTGSSNGNSDQAVISGDGRYVAYRSSATDLVGTPTNYDQIYRWDRLTNTTVLISFSSTGTSGANWYNYQPSISDNGNIVAWQTQSTDSTALVDSNGTYDVVVRNVTAGTTSLVSKNSAGTAAGNNSASDAIVSGDGSRVVFSSFSDDLTALADGNFDADIFVYTLASGVNTLVSRNSSGTASAAAGSYYPSISNDGSRVAFYTYSANVIASDGNGTWDVFAFTVATTTNVLVSANTGGASANAQSIRPQISGDGNFVAFESYATDIVLTAANGNSQIFRRNLTAGTTQLISINSSGTNGGNNLSQHPQISDNGNIVVWESFATDLSPHADVNAAMDAFVRNVTAGTTGLLSINSGGTGTANGASSTPAVAAGGGFAIFSTFGTNLLASYSDYNGGGEDIYGRDLGAATTFAVSARAPGLFASYTVSTGSISANGQKIAWVGYGSDITPNDINGYTDVYLFDVATQTNSLVSVNSGGTDSGDWYADQPAISSNGQFVAFRSAAANLLAIDTNGYFSDIYVRNLTAGTTQLISYNSTGLGSGSSNADAPSISADGSIVAFRSLSTDHVGGIVDANGDYDVFIRNRTAGTTVFASVNSTGAAAANGASTDPLVSDDGSRVTFETSATNLLAGTTDFNVSQADIYARSVTAGTTALVSIKAAGVFTASGFSDQASISDDGQRIAFHSFANNLVNNDLNSYDDVFYWDAGTTSNTLVSVSTSGVGGDWFGWEPTISANGQFVAFTAGAANLTTNDSNAYTHDIFLRNLTAGTTELISLNSTGLGSGDGNASQASVSSNGAIVAFRSNGSSYVGGIVDANFSDDIFVRNRTAGTTVLASANSAGTATANGSSASAIVASDGSRVVFASTAQNIIAGIIDVNGTGTDLFARNLAAGTTALITVRAAGLFTANFGSDNATISSDGKRIAYQSQSINLVVPDHNGYIDVFVWDETAAANLLVSVNSGGTVSANSHSYYPVISGNGQFVAFTSTGYDIVALDIDYTADVYRRDLLTNTTALISINSAGTAGGNAASERPAIDASGAVVAFRSNATDLVNLPDSNGTSDTFVRYVPTSSTSLLSRNAAGAGNNGSDTFTLVSADGSVVVFRNLSSNLVAGVSDLNGDWDLFAAFRDPVTALVVGPVTPDPRSTFVSSVQVTLSRIVDLATFTSADFTLKRNAGPNLLTGAQTVTYVGGTTYQINNLSGLTNLAGTYDLTVNMSGVNDPLGDAGAGIESDSWLMDLTTPVPTSVAPVVPNPRNTTVSQIDFTFSEPLDLSTLTAADLTLTNGGPNLLTGSEPVTLVSGSTYRISGLSGLTGADGVYTLTVFGAGVTDLAANVGSGSAFTSWTMDTQGPQVSNVYFDGTAWAGAFRVAAGNGTFGFPAQTGANQLQSMPWSTVNTFYIEFSEPVGTVTSLQVGVRGIIVPTYAVSTVTMFSPTVAKIVLSGAIDTDRIVIDIDGDTGGGVADGLGNRLRGSWTDSVSSFPSSGANAVDFKFRFVVAVGDADRNGIVRNADLNIVRNNLFIDVGAGSYNKFADIDGNGLLRNADLNATRNHLFIDAPPAGPGPTGPQSGRATAGGARGAANGRLYAASQPAVLERTGAIARRTHAAATVAVLDELFATE